MCNNIYSLFALKPIKQSMSTGIKLTTVQEHAKEYYNKLNFNNLVAENLEKKLPSYSIYTLY